MKLRDLYLKDIERKIQGVIKINDETHIVQELEEYVITEEVLKNLYSFVSEYNNGLNSRTENIGVWISGGYGSGKSHFLKILSYLIENKKAGDKNFADYFREKISDSKLFADIQRIGNFSSDVILFDIVDQVEHKGTTNTSVILSVLEKTFNEKLGLSLIPHLAKAERILIDNGKYEDFKKEYKAETSNDWEKVRNDYYFIKEDIVRIYSKVMGKSESYIDLDKIEENYSLSINSFSEIIKDYINKKGNDHHVIFLIDELGQYIENDKKLMVDLQTIIQSFGVVCGGKCWVIATGQSDINAYLGNDLNNFSKIMARFDTRLMFSGANVDEVIKKRILSKTAVAKETLKLQYLKKESTVKNLLTFSSTAEQKIYSDAEEFCDVYPFVTYQFNLLQNVFSWIGQTGAAGAHLSKAERTLLYGFQTTAKMYANHELGTLVPFYDFYDTISNFLNDNVKLVIEGAKKNNQLKENDIKVLKILFMLKNIKEIPTNIDNIATLFVSNIDDDKIEIKENIKESLKRLELQTLIQRNNTEYIFLTNEEQEINREIKNIVISGNEITDFLKKMIYEQILTDRKFMYINKYPFPISLYVDNSKLGQEAEMGVRVITNATDRGEVAIIAESMRESKYIYLKLDIPTIISKEIENILQFNEYQKQKNGIDVTEQVDDIIRAKRKVANDSEKRIVITLSELLKNSDIYIGGDKQNINSKTPIDRVREAFNILVCRVYSKISYIETNFSNSDIRKLFNEPMTNLLGNEIGKPNIKAYKAIEEYLKEKSDLSISYGNITIRSLLQDFEKQPYGFLTDDILYLLTRLLKDEVISLVYNSETQNIASEETLAKITNRAYYDKTIIKLRKKVNQELIINLKNISRNVFNNVSLREDEDGMMYDFKEKNLSKTASELKQKLDDYQRFDHYSYPGKNILESTIELLENIASIKDTTLFFEEVNNKKDVIKSNIESVKDVLEFFKTQRTVFDQAKDIIKIYEDNKDYTDDNKKLKELAEETIGILTMDSPYSEIHKLPSLRQQIINIMSEIYDEKSKPIIDVVQKTIEYIENTVKENELSMSIAQNFIDTCKKTINDLEKSNELKDIYAKQTYIDNIKDEFIKRVESEKRKTSAPDKPVIERKIISVQNVMTKTYEIDSKEDIDKYVSELREKLVEELEKNKFIRIK